MGDLVCSSADRIICFGPFRLLSTQRLLLDADKSLRLGSRAFDILIVLTERPGELVTKEELQARVWPNTNVEGGNLKVHIACLRRLLSDGRGGNRYIVNIPRQGYRFVAPVTLTDGAKTLSSRAIAAEPSHNLPGSVRRPVGRAEFISMLIDECRTKRFLTIIGPGGVGKTTVAIAAAEAMISAYTDGIRFVDMGALQNPALAPSALASALGVGVSSANPTSRIISFLKERKMLLVLDNCEHIIEAVSALARNILRNTTGVHILGTSREPLRAEGEHVLRLSPLAIPSLSETLSAPEALSFSAIQLFVERATANLSEFELDGANTATVAEICRKLAGIPLAIELAAACVDAFGVHELARRLGDRFRLPMQGHHPALPQHRALRTTHEWSYEHLPQAERAVLQRLSIFAGCFELDAAVAVAAEVEGAFFDAADSIASLVAKSLISADLSGNSIYYRLLDTTRMYAREKLLESGKLEQIARRHAEFYRDYFSTTEKRVTSLSSAQFSPLIDNVRTALDWAFSPTGDVLLGIALTAGCIPLWIRMLLSDECRRRVENALAMLPIGSDRNSRIEMMLLTGLGLASHFTRGPIPATAEAFAGALKLAESLKDLEYQRQAFWGQWAFHHTLGEHGRALTPARRFHELSVSGYDQLIGQCLVGVSLHYKGDQFDARRHVEQTLASDFAPDSVSIPYRFDRSELAITTLARIHFLQGFPDQAMKLVRRNLAEIPPDEAYPQIHALLEGAFPIALAVGNLGAAEVFLARMQEVARKHEIPLFQLADRLKGEMLVKQGDVLNGVEILRTCLEASRRVSFALGLTHMLGALADGLTALGAAAEGLTVIDEALTRSENDNELWNFAELLRIKGELILSAGEPNASALAEDLFVRSSDCAHRQGALAWKLRSATSLARMRFQQGRASEARDALEPVYGCFSEGFETVDLQNSKRLLEQFAAC